MLVQLAGIQTNKGYCLVLEKYRQKLLDEMIISGYKILFSEKVMRNVSDEQRKKLEEIPRLKGAKC